MCKKALLIALLFFACAGDNLVQSVSDDMVLLDTQIKHVNYLLAAEGIRYTTAPFDWVDDPNRQYVGWEMGREPNFFYIIVDYQIRHNILYGGAIALSRLDDNLARKYLRLWRLDDKTITGILERMKTTITTEEIKEVGNVRIRILTTAANKTHIYIYPKSIEL